MAPNIKTFLGSTTSGLTLFFEAWTDDLNFMDNADDGVFRYPATDTKNPATEKGTTGIYYRLESRQVFADGNVYSRLVDSTGKVWARGGKMEILNDQDVLVGSRAAEAGGNLATVLGRVPGEVAQKSHLVNGAGNITPPTDKGIWDSLGDGTERADKATQTSMAGTVSTNLDAQVSLTAKEDGGRLEDIDTLTATELDTNVGSRATPADVTAGTNAVLGAMQNLNRYGGTLTADGTEQIVKEFTPSNVMIAYRGLLDLSNMETGDTVVVTEYYKLKSGGIYLKMDSYSFSGAQTAYPVVDITPQMPNRYGSKVTIQQTAQGAGGYKDFDWELFSGELT